MKYMTLTYTKKALMSHSRFPAKLASMIYDDASAIDVRVTALEVTGLPATIGDGTLALGKLVNLASAGNIIVANGSKVPSDVTMSGDATISSAGAVTIANSAITNAKVSASAAIAYSKLNLSSSIVNADISASAAIAHSKLATGTAGNILVADVSGNFTSMTLGGDGTITSAGVFALSNDVDVTKLTAATGSSMTLAGNADYHIINKLGDTDGHAIFKVQDSAATDLYKVASNGAITLKGGATLDNYTSGTELNITETNVKVTGNFETTGTITLPTTVALTCDTINSIASKSLKLTGVADYHIINKLGDADGHAAFKVTDSADVELLKLDSTGVFTLENGATITNSSSANTLTVTETNIELTGDVKPSSITMTNGQTITNNTINSVTGQDFTLTAAAGKDVDIKLGDNAAANNLSVKDSDAADIFVVDSNGGLTLVNGTTIDNKTAADTLTITETNIGLSGAVTATSLAVTGAITGSNQTYTESTHNYAGGHADWTLSSTEQKTFMLVCSNADAGANIIAPQTDGKAFCVRNVSGQTITIMKTAGAGVGVADNKTAIVRYSASVGDYVRVTADATH
jgi:hypothetical protein